MKKQAGIVLAVLALSVPHMAGFAEGIGVLDVEKVLGSYEKVQSAVADLKVKEADLEKFAADAGKSVKLAKTQEESRNLELNYSKQLEEKKVAYRQEQSHVVERIQADVFIAIRSVADSRKVKLVIRKDSIIYGADDLTDEVIGILNKNND